MVTTIKAIETQYNGYRFRSRLEARYAVFFDSLGIRYDYEPEGFEMRGDKRYLPDFWLPDLRSWVEIKGSIPTDDETALMYELTGAQQCIGHIFHGAPGVYWGVSFCWDVSNSGGGQSAPSSSQWYGCSSCGAIGVLIDNSNDLFFDGYFEKPLDFCSCPSAFRDVSHKRLRMAYDAARSARFEFGERGR